MKRQFNSSHHKKTSLQQFMDEHNIILPQLSEDQKDMLSEEFSREEIGDALKDA
jgi:hypothetical protein